MKEKEFNLLDEPWIRVLLPDYTVQEVSLPDALLHAHEYLDLAGEMPAQDAAMLRLLLAVLHTVFSRVDKDGEPAPFEDPEDAVDRWDALWGMGRFPEAPIRDYLDAWRERFWLFHPERPFWQVPEAEIGTQYGAPKLNGEISESGNKLRLFPVYAGAGKAEMAYPQAARWLLYINGFDDTSAKPKGKGLPSIGAGWLGRLGLIFAAGGNLFETLMLNLIFLKDGKTLWGPQRPCWELEKARSGERQMVVWTEETVNAAELLTLQSRRLLLHRQGDRVDGFALLGGDFFDREDAFFEQMTVWRKLQDKKNAPAMFVPQRHDPAKLFWREFSSVFVEQKNVHRPGIVGWIDRLQREKRLGQGKMARFRIVGVKYGDKDFFVTDAFSDTLSFHASLLDELGRPWQNRVTLEISRLEELAGALGLLAADLDKAAGGRSGGAYQKAEQLFYFTIDQPFRQWLYTVDPSWDMEKTGESLKGWRRQAQQVARRLGEQLVREAGPAAFTGRTLKEKEKGKEDERYYTAPRAFNAFLSKVRKIYEDGGGKKCAYNR